jgi:23S rRNA pseudouridine2605 synthase
VRLQKLLADAGIASRRASEELILGGHVTVNGQVVRELGSRADPDQDRITFDGKPIKARRKIYIAINKPRRVLCTRAPDERRETVLDLLPKEWSNVYPVGRLDYDSEGLLFLTNDGDFCLHLTHPRYGVRKKYLATVRGAVDSGIARELTRGVHDAGQLLRAEQARVLESSPTHSVVQLEMGEGRYREVRRMFEVLGSKVLQLRRVQIGPVKLGELKPGRWRILQPAEIRALTSGTPAESPRPPGRRRARAGSSMPARTIGPDRRRAFGRSPAEH